MTEEQIPPVSDKKEAMVDEIKVQAQDLVKTVEGIIKKGTASRVTVTRGERTLVDLPLTLGVAAGALMAIYMPVISAIVGVVALLGGCTVRVEREEPPVS